MKNLRVCLALWALLIIMLMRSTFAAGFDLYVDLDAQPAGTTVERPLSILERTSVSIIILNLDPESTYRIFVSLDNAELPSISIDARQSLSALLQTLESESLEKGGGTAPSTLGNPEWEEEESIMTLQSPTPTTFTEGTGYRLSNVAVVRPGQELKVQITKWVEGSQSTITWTTIFDGGSRGGWNISLGFGIPILLDGHQRYATHHDSEDIYRIVSVPDEERFELIPAVFFHWVPVRSELSDWSWSLSGGLGLNFDKAVLFLGSAVTFNRNISVSVGGVAHQVKRLNPRYRAGEIVPIELDEEQLHTTFYRINPYVGVTFQLSSNIFGD